MKKISAFLFLSLFLSGCLFAQAPKKVILEDFTGSWCGFCPRGLTYSNTIEAANPNVIALGIHQGSTPSSDAMATPFTNSLCAFLTNGYPKGGIDRFKMTGQTSIAVTTNLWSIACNSRLNSSSPLNVYLNSYYNSTTRLVDVTVTANFVAGAVGDLRVHCLLVEDSLTGVGAGWDQYNFMGQSCNFPDPSSPWFIFPCVISGYTHRHVVRHQMANDTWGESGIIPNPAVQGQDYSKTFSYTLPASWNDSKMSIVAFVSRYGASDTSRSILNANKVHLGGSVTGLSEPITGTSVISGLDQNYPNPFSEFTNINFTLQGSDHVTLKVYDLLGKEVSTIVDEKLSGGKYNYIWNGMGNDGRLASGGLYFYRLATSSQVFTKQMTFIRN